VFNDISSIVNRRYLLFPINMPLVMWTAMLVVACECCCSCEAWNCNGVDDWC